jgi:hypothetical protein
MFVLGAESNRQLYVFDIPSQAWAVGPTAPYDGGWGDSLEYVPASDRVYQIDGRDSAGTPQGTAALVLQPTTPPQNATGCPSGNASFSVIPGGAGPFTFSWQVFDPGLGQWRTLGNDPAPLNCGGSAFASPSFASQTTIGISPCPGINAYQVRCLISGPCGTTPTAAATYTVCIANCDCSSTPPVLNANDFQCFLNRFAEASPYANCDGSSVPPVLNANDFQCFLNAFAAGCN